MGAAKVSTLSVKYTTGADTFFPDMVVSLCVPYTHSYSPLCSFQCTAKLCNATPILDQPPYVICA